MYIKQPYLEKIRLGNSNSHVPRTIENLFIELVRKIHSSDISPTDLYVLNDTSKK